LYLMLLLTLKGTPFLYNGEEVGMTDYVISDPSLFRDPLSTLFYNWAKSLLGMNEEEAIKVGAIRGRDKCRTPMQWNSTANGGFCPENVSPWLPVNPNFSKGINVDEEDEDGRSLLSFYKKMLKIRKESRVLQLGDYQSLEIENPSILFFTRSSLTDKVWVLLNMSPIAQSLPVNLEFKNRKILISTYGTPDLGSSGNCILQPYQGILFS